MLTTCLPYPHPVNPSRSFCTWFPARHVCLACETPRVVSVEVLAKQEISGGFRRRTEPGPVVMPLCHRQNDCALRWRAVLAICLAFFGCPTCSLVADGVHNPLASPTLTGMPCSDRRLLPPPPPPTTPPLPLPRVSMLPGFKRKFFRLLISVSTPCSSCPSPLISAYGPNDKLPVFIFRREIPLFYQQARDIENSKPIGQRRTTDFSITKKSKFTRTSVE